MRIAVAVVVGLLVAGTGPLRAGIGFDALPVGCSWKTKMPAKGTAVGGVPYPDEYFQTGDFGVIAKNNAANYSARLIEMKNCALGS